jgi:hypothetical protein
LDKLLVNMPSRQILVLHPAFLAIFRAHARPFTTRGGRSEDPDPVAIAEPGYRLFDLGDATPDGERLNGDKALANWLLPRLPSAMSQQAD